MFEHCFCGSRHCHGGPLHHHRKLIGQKHERLVARRSAIYHESSRTQTKLEGLDYVMKCVMLCNVMFFYCMFLCAIVCSRMLSLHTVFASHNRGCNCNWKIIPCRDRGCNCNPRSIPEGKGTACNTFFARMVVDVLRQGCRAHTKNGSTW